MITVLRPPSETKVTQFLRDALLIRFTPEISEDDSEQRISLSPIPGRKIILGVKFTDGIEVVRSQPQTAAA